ncbi:MAG: cell wall-active antibiotics response protein [Gemmatimonadota bacterium]|nr:cell wall-active antibiotics response protein [Gemmatimonadota bacterium]
MADYKPIDERITGLTETSYVGQAYPLAAEPPSSDGVVSFLSSNEREGRWPLPRRFRALAVLGNVELDLREADIGLGVSVIEAVAVMGNIEITVPPDVAVESSGDSLLGSFVVKYAKGVSAGTATGYKKVHITGTAYAASVEVHVKGPDEPMLARLGRTLGIK